MNASRGWLAVALLGGVVLLGAGCQSQQLRREPLTTQQVIDLAAQNRPPEEIIQRIRESGTVYILHARDVKDLLEKGVPEPVVDEMMQTRLRDAAYRYSYYPYPYYYPYAHPYWYGPYSYWGFGVGIYP